LRGYRIPGSKDRRIPLSHLIRFMRAHGMPLDGLDSGLIRVLLLDADQQFAASVRDGLNRSGFEVSTAASAFEAGAMAERLRPQVIVVDVSVPELSLQSLVQHIRSDEAMSTTRLVAIGPKLANGGGQALKQLGVDACLAKPFDIQQLVHTIEEAVAESPPT
jgi:DNA-binding response OmpR family regulator